MQLILIKQEQQDINHTWDNLTGSAKHGRVDEDGMQIESEIPQHLVV